MIGAHSIAFAADSNPPAALAGLFLDAARHLTVRVTGIVCVTPPPLAVRVTVFVTAVADEETLTVLVIVPLPGAANEDLDNDTVTPAGNPLHEKFTAELNMP